MGWNMRQRIIGVLFLYLGVAACASAQTANITPTIEAIIADMAQARAENQARFRSYVVTRDYKLFGKEKAKTYLKTKAKFSLANICHIGIWKSFRTPSNGGMSRHWNALQPFPQCKSVRCS